MKPSAVSRENLELLARLEALPPVAEDCSTPEGAILCFEGACRRRDLEAAVACMDFLTLARRTIQEAEKLSDKDPSEIAALADRFDKAFRALIVKYWLHSDGKKMFFPKRETQTDGTVLVTQVAFDKHGKSSSEQLVVAETAAGWRVAWTPLRY